VATRSTTSTATATTPATAIPTAAPTTAAAPHPPTLAALIDAALAGDLTPEQAHVLVALRHEAIIAALLATVARIAQLQRAAAVAADAAPLPTPPFGTPTPSTPSGAIPPYLKPPAAKGKRRRRPGAKVGHPGARRPAPPAIDRRVEHRLTHCPDCGGKVHRRTRTRTRTIADIPERITPIVTAWRTCCASW